MADPPPLSRWSLAVLSLAAAAVLGWGARTLPWEQLTTFAVLTGLLALLHLATGVLALAGAGARARAWRVQSWAALAWLGWIAWKLSTAAVYIAQVYGGMGDGMAVVLVACTGLCALVVLPLAVWGLAATGGLGWRKREAGTAVGLAALGLGGLGLSGLEAQAQPTPAGVDPSVLATLAAAPGPRAPGLAVRTPAVCGEPPGPENLTAFVTLARARAAGDPEVTLACVQAPDAAALVPQLTRLAAQAVPGSTLKIDQVSAVQVLPAVSGVQGALALRPGLDGACRGETCLMPWQLVILDHFNSFRPFPAIPDIRFGVEPIVLQHALGGPSDAAGFEGLTRMVTRSHVIQAGGRVTELTRMHGPRPAVTPEQLTLSAAAAQARVVDANLPDGRFRYLMDPFQGTTSSKDFALARQGGTTYTLCDVGDRSDAVDQAAARSLDMMAALERDLGNGLGALQYPAGRVTRRIGIRNSTLPLVALLTCRDRVGPVHDELIGRLGRFLLAMQRDDGGYHPFWDRELDQPQLGTEPVYAGGQATLALVLLEHLQRREDLAALPPLAELSAAVERSMGWYGGDYWDHGAREFLWVEENWHCIAARTALSGHRHDGYERFCIDYVAMKRRLVLGPDDGVDADMVGGFGWGNLGVPHNTGTAGFLEALSASMAVKQARGEPLDADRDQLRHSLGYLLQNQWGAASCFACAPDPVVHGAWSEHMASPIIRIDYIQHAWAGVAHGARLLGAGS